MFGVLQIEVMVQIGGILVFLIVEDLGNWDIYFLKIENVKFKNKVVFGDIVLFKLEFMVFICWGICQMFGIVYVGKKIVFEV